MAISNIQAKTLQKIKEESDSILLIDVREEQEFAEVSSPYAKNFPLSSLDVDHVLVENQLTVEDSSTPLYFICRSGARSMKAAEKFHAAGYENVFNVEGGMNRWVDLELPIRK